jgi:hypothetical protein
VAVHPSSINSGIEFREPPAGQLRACPLVIYDEITRGDTRLYVHQCTAVNPHFLPLVTSHLDILPDDDFTVYDLLSNGADGEDHG